MFGVVSAHESPFVVVWFFSHLDSATELIVTSTETGVRLLEMSFQREFEVLALSADDQTVAISSSELPGKSTDAGRDRCILGIHVVTKEIVFRMSVTDVHQDGISHMAFVRNVRRGSESLLTIGGSTSRDLAFWDLETNTIDFVLELIEPVDLYHVAEQNKMLVCVSAQDGTITVVNLARGCIESKARETAFLLLTRNPPISRLSETPHHST